MTDDAAIKLITGSNVFKASGSSFQKAWQLFARANPKSAAWLYRGMAGDFGGPIPPGLTETPYGQGMRHFVISGKVVLVPTTSTLAPPLTPPKPEPLPAPTPITKPIRPAVTGAMVIRGGAMMDSENSNQGLHRAGVKHLAIMINPLDNDVTDNLLKFDTGMKNWFESRGFKVGGFMVNYYNPTTEAEAAFHLCRKYGLEFLVCDIERHKSDLAQGDMKLTHSLANHLRVLFGNDFPLWAVGYGQHSSLQVVNHAVLDAYRIDYVDECYDEHGITDGVVVGMDKVAREGRSPADLAIGNKSLAMDAPWISHARAVGGNRLRDVWLWCPESGEAQEELSKGISFV